MKVCLVSAPTATDFEDPTLAESDAIRIVAEHAPLGILSLAAVLEDGGRPPALLDLNQLYYEWLRGGADVRGQADFCSSAAERLAAQNADVWGFSTICSSYPLTLRIVNVLKRLRPDITVVLGGPQASVVDVATLGAFPAVDFVVRGEAESTFPWLLEQLVHGGDPGEVPGITYRRDGRVTRNANAPPIADLDALPFPAFHLYPRVDQCRYLPLELGRGCPFACSFCSTNDFFRRNFRLKSPARMLADMTRVNTTYGIDNFDLVHDMFTVDRRKVMAFCRAILDSGDRFFWGCSARTDCIDEELIRLMHRAGCRGIFFGIESGSPTLQKVIKKRLDLDESRRMIACSTGRGIKTAVSLITGFPEETMADYRDTVDFFMDSLRLDHADPQLCLLAPLAETPIESLHREELVFDDIISDMSFQGWRQDPADRELIGAHRDIFVNFYSVPTPHLDRRFIREFREFILVAAATFRWLLVGLHQLAGSIVDVFIAWQDWCREAAVSLPGDSIAERYSSASFRRSFLDFVRARYAGVDKHGRVIALLAQYEELLLAPAEPTAELPAEVARSPVAEALIAPEMVPILAPGVRVLRLAGDYRRVVRSLKRAVPLARWSTREVTVIARDRAGEGSDILQLSSFSAELLRLCDGERNVGAVAEAFAGVTDTVGGVSPHSAAIFGLELLRRQGLVVILAATSAAA